MHEPPFVLKISRHDLELLQRLAQVLGLAFPDDLSRKLVSDGVWRLNEPATIEVDLAAERERLLKVIAELKRDTDLDEAPEPSLE